MYPIKLTEELILISTRAEHLVAGELASVRCALSFRDKKGSLLISIAKLERGEALLTEDFSPEERKILIFAIHDHWSKIVDAVKSFSKEWVQSYCE